MHSADNPLAIHLTPSTVYRLVDTLLESWVDPYGAFLIDARIGPTTKYKRGLVLGGPENLRSTFQRRRTYLHGVLVEKWCSGCGQYLPAHAFWRTSASLDGRMFRCIACMRRTSRRPVARVTACRNPGRTLCGGAGGG